MRHLISVGDLTDQDCQSILDLGVRFAEDRASGAGELRGLVTGIYFRKTSTRTRTAFSAGALRLGAEIVSFGPDDLQINTGETMGDTGRVLSGMLDILVARTAGTTAELRTLASQDRMAVVNAMSAAEHPTQALADMTTLLRHFGHIDGLRILYAGEGNNTAAALALALTRFRRMELEFRTPPGYGLAADIRIQAAAQASQYGSQFNERHSMEDVGGGFDVIYTTQWQTTGTTKADRNWRAIFAPFQVRPELWRDSPRAVFLHDLPAHRGQEVTAEVLDGPHSLAFRQAENKLYSAMAVLTWCHQPAFPLASQLRSASDGERPR